MADTAPASKVLTATIPAPATATTTQDQAIGEAPYAGEVSAVSVISEGAVTAHATNYRTLRLLNKGQAGAGTTVVASLALDTPTTDDLAAKDEKNLTLSSTATDLDVAAGDVLAWDETIAASGLLHTGLTVQVTISRGLS